MIQLDESLFLGKGYHKAAYQHPSDSNICVKVMINDAIDAKKQLHREINHHLVLQKKWNTRQIPGLANYLGQAETNLGTGYLFELIRDYDGKVSKSLEDFLNDPTLFEQHKIQIKENLNQLKKRMLDYSIIPMKIYPWNIFYRKISATESECILIDDIGSASFIPLEYYFKFFADKRIERRFKKLELIF